MGITIPFYFEKRKKIVKALQGVEEMRKNVDALLIVNNERLCDVYADSEITVKDAFKLADKVLSDATKDKDDYQKIIDKLYHPIRDNFQFQKKEDSPKEEIPTNPSTNESTNIPDEPAPLFPEAPIEESPVIEEEPIEPVVQQEPPTLAKRIRDRLKKIAEDLDIITEDE